MQSFDRAVRHNLSLVAPETRLLRIAASSSVRVSRPLKAVRRTVSMGSTP